MDAGYFRTCTTVGLSMQLIGIFATSVSTQYWQLVLSQGVCQGVGNGLLFCPAVANVATYFSPRRRALAVSCVACGGATGGMVFPAISKSFLGKIGFGWTLRVMGFVMLFNAVLIVAFSRTRLSPKASASFLDRTAFQEPAFALHCVGVFLVFWAVWIVYFFIRSFALDMLGASQALSFDLLLVLNGLGLPGRLIPALISDRYLGPVNTLLASSVAAAVLLFCWIAVNSIGALFVWDAMYGFFGGSIQALTLASASSFTLDMSNIGSRVGLTFVVLGLSSLTGPAIGGALIAVHHHSYLPAQLFAGVAMTAGSIVLVLARVAQTGPQLRSRF
jgi:MFS family permease